LPHGFIKCVAEDGVNLLHRKTSPPVLFDDTQNKVGTEPASEMIAAGSPTPPFAGGYNITVQAALVNVRAATFAGMSATAADSRGKILQRTFAGVKEKSQLLRWRRSWL